MTTKPLTGRTVFFITASAFAVIIGVNLVLAFSAVRTFPGLEVKNSYVASQTFDRDRAAQEALGWTSEAAFEDGILTLGFTDAAGFPVEPVSLSAVLGRATNVAEDRSPEFVFSAGRFVAEEELGAGNWNLRIEAVAEDGTVFKQRLALYVRPVR